MEKKTLTTIIALLCICVVIAVVPLMTIHDSEFGGADGEAEGVIMEINESYEPWFESIIELPGGETESLLFCLQAAIGGIVLGGGFGYYFGRKSGTKGAK